MSEEAKLEFTERELALIIEAMNEYYLRAITRAQRGNRIRPRKVNESLGFIQQTLQRITVYTNMRKGKLYAEPPPEASDSTGNQELARDKGTNTPST